MKRPDKTAVLSAGFSQQDYELEMNRYIDSLEEKIERLKGDLSKIEALQLFKDDFDNTENRNPGTSKSLGIFIKGNNLSASGKVSRFISELEPVKIYLGWDGNVYPKFRLEKINIK